jgi:uncharacterized membrane-anchored protein
MLDSVGKVERYRREANRCAELAKEANPAFPAEIYRKVALRYVFMAEELLMGADRHSDAIEKADRMNSSLRSDVQSCVPSLQPLSAQFDPRATTSRPGAVASRGCPDS